MYIGQCTKQLVHIQLKFKHNIFFYEYTIFTFYREKLLKATISSTQIDIMSSHSIIKLNDIILWNLLLLCIIIWTGKEKYKIIIKTTKQNDYTNSLIDQIKSIS